MAIGELMRIKVKPTQEHPDLKTISIYVTGMDFQAQCAFFEVFWEDENAVHLQMPSNLCLEGEHYANWGAEDLPYIKDWVLEQCQLEEDNA